MFNFKKTLAVGATAIGLTAGMLVAAPAAQADTQTRWYNDLRICRMDTDNRVKHYRLKGYTVSVQRYCKGEQYIGYRPQYQSIIYVN
ncbi:hypothetical protein [Arthrobacter sp. NIO-1057]|uniref:hypothetical protein n=1 Tax=Arthrobacter sp. NIO-1057 TaxID=993071 RepID=UPI00071D1985|nr:hypothetical protein [Arthrobacter sp. NIO-1057]KSU66047.1 hypothetical protein AS038_10245 [Arthrobacter sp. NIO-1057]SCC30818.1 hypothetical protein GA0061084_2087 [Arthrobacter sp. NIO-1057]